MTVRTLKVLACADEGVNTAPRGDLSGVGPPLKRVEQPRSGQVHPRQPGGRVAGLPRCGLMRPLCHEAAAAPLPTSCVTLLQKARELRSRHRLAVVGRLVGGIAERGHAHEAGVVLHGGIGVVADVFAAELPSVIPGERVKMRVRGYGGGVWGGVGGWVWGGDVEGCGPVPPLSRMRRRISEGEIDGAPVAPHTQRRAVHRRRARRAAARKVEHVAVWLE